MRETIITIQYRLLSAEPYLNPTQRPDSVVDSCRICPRHFAFCGLLSSGQSLHINYRQLYCLSPPASCQMEVHIQYSTMYQSVQNIHPPADQLAQLLTRASGGCTRVARWSCLIQPEVTTPRKRAAGGDAVPSHQLNRSTQSLYAVAGASGWRFLSTSPSLECYSSPIVLYPIAQ